MALTSFIIKIMNKRLFFFTLIPLAMVGGYCLLGGEQQLSNTSIRKPDSTPTKVVAQSSIKDGAGTIMTAWGYSPFSTASPSTVPDTKTLATERMEKMRSMGVNTPEKYFFMPLKTLKELGKMGDTFALLQLGQQYWDERAMLEQDPDYDFKENPKALALQYTNEAFLAGYNHAALILAHRLSQENPTEAYAWALVSRELGDTDANKVLLSTSSLLNSPQIQQAQLIAMNKSLELSKLWAAKLYPNENRPQ
ncbi:hypothetical protein LPN04_08170 [Rugamonas sp. A1-17]|nr:hypothetical protein [Rugamonas sp. A1-17]